MQARISETFATVRQRLSGQSAGLSGRRLVPVMLAGVLLGLAAGVPDAEAQGLFGTSGRLAKQTVSIQTREKVGTVIVSFADRRLYKITGRGRAISYPIGVPKKLARWNGTLRVTQKRKNPAWRPTRSMLKRNPKLPSYVPGGHPQNPMGVRALYLGHTFYRIHGTDAPWTIGKAASSGCVRMYNDHAIDLYNRTKIGAKVVVNWKRYKTSSSLAGA
ncbi:MAG: L,D-transpeptidase [Alphaproteobacteria bacterium]|nr:L,D-transpeptidase [Alphaproteobacteria bacterium]